ncbi:MAG: thioesterase family protein [Xanthobacteraceae bacterium]
MSLEMRNGAADLAEATTVHGSNGSYRAGLSRSWEIWGPNGGYLASLALRAASQLAELRRPASLNCHFLSSPEFREVALEVQVLKRGRRSESISVQMRQDDRPILHALIRTVADAPGYQHQRVSAPQAPLPRDLRSYQELWPDDAGLRLPFWRNIEGRPVDQSIDRGPRRGPRLDWVRFQPKACFDDVFVDAARGLILLDTYGGPAASYGYRDNAFIAPNLDVSVWFHQFTPLSEWLLIEQECPIAAGGLMGVNGRIWDCEGRLLATGSAHLCCLPADQQPR